MKHYFSKGGAVLCAVLSISFYFVALTPRAQAAQSTSSAAGYVVPGMSREASTQLLERHAAAEAASSAGVTSSSVSGTGSVGASAVPTPDVTEKKIAAASTYTQMSQQATDSSGRVFVVWQDTRNGGSSILFSRTLDHGQTWSAIKRLDRSSGAGTTQFVEIAADDFCNVYVGWNDFRNVADGQPFVAVSHDCGDTWSAAKRLSAASVAQDSSFDMAARNGGQIFVVWGDSRNDDVGGLLRTEIYSIVSNDFGATWQTEKKISDQAPTTTDDYGPITTWAQDGGLVVAWLSNRNGPGYDLYEARSANGGSTWSADARLNTEAAGTVAVPAYGLCADREHVFLSYTIGTGSPFDVKARTSHDFGKTFAAPVTINGTLDTLGNGQALDCAGDRAVIAFDGGTAGSMLDDVRVSTTEDGGATWSSAKKVDVDDASNSGNNPVDITTSITAQGDVVVGFTDGRGGTTHGYFNYSPDGGTLWLSHEKRFNSFTGSHTVLLSRELGVLLSTPEDGAGAGSDLGAHAWITYDDNRADAPGMYSARIDFDHASTPLVRLSGDNRVETALEISQDSFPTDGSATAVVVATSKNFPDGLAGGPLSVMAGGPLLLTPGDSLDAAVAAEITRLFDGQDDTGTDVYILGGDAAIDPSVEAAIAALDSKLDIKRLEGTDRIATALAVADELTDLRGTGPVQLVLANSQNFPDALSASAAASSSIVEPGLMPILLNPTAALDSRVSTYLSDNVGTVLMVNVVGGTSVISDATFTTTDAIIPATRYGGVNRYDTATIFNTAMFTGSKAPTSIGVASGEKFPDALTGGAHSGRLNRPLVLVKQNDVPDESTVYVEDNAATIEGGHVYGGTSAVSDAVKTFLEALY